MNGTTARCHRGSSRVRYRPEWQAFSLTTRRRFVVVASRRRSLDAWLEHHPNTLYVHDDEADDAALQRAGLRWASGGTSRRSTKIVSAGFAGWMTIASAMAPRGVWSRRQSWCRFARPNPQSPRGIGRPRAYRGVPLRIAHLLSPLGNGEPKAARSVKAPMPAGLARNRTPRHDIVSSHVTAAVRMLQFVSG